MAQKVVSLIFFYNKLRIIKMINDLRTKSSFEVKLKLFAKCFLLALLIKIVGTIVIIIAEALIFDGSIPLYRNQIELTDTYGPYFSIVLIIIVFPILEELGFRGWFSENIFLTSVSLTVSLFYFLYVVLIILIPTIIPTERVHRFLFIFLALPFGFIFFYRHFLSIRRSIELRHSWLVIISIITFSCVHAFNYPITEFNSKTALAMILILLPYPFSGFIYTYVRIKNGLAWSIALHIMNNSFVLIPVLLLGKKI